MRSAAGGRQASRGGGRCSVAVWRHGTVDGECPQPSRRCVASRFKKKKTRASRGGRLIALGHRNRTCTGLRARAGGVSSAREGRGPSAKHDQRLLSDGSTLNRPRRSPSRAGRPPPLSLLNIAPPPSPSPVLGSLQTTHAQTKAPDTHTHTRPSSNTTRRRDSLHFHLPFTQPSSPNPTPSLLHVVIHDVAPHPLARNCPPRGLVCRARHRRLPLRRHERLSVVRSMGRRRARPGRHLCRRRLPAW